MKQGKLEGMIKSVKMRTEWEQENIERCMKEIKDLGFGEIFMSSGKVWHYEMTM